MGADTLTRYLIDYTRECGYTVGFTVVKTEGYLKWEDRIDIEYFYPTTKPYRREVFEGDAYKTFKEAREIGERVVQRNYEQWLSDTKMLEKIFSDNLYLQQPE